ncbi:MAG TPA: proteasome assembly chaperone family protein [Thermoplasmata archaeon]|nr:proteasome assembly chaperone family protein [Thermoplasmata archaeon]
MENIVVRYLERPTLNDPIFIEGLPGIGNVGKLAAEHLRDELKGVKFAEIFSKFFPPQVLVQEDGLVKLVDNELYYVRREGKRDFVILVGDYQGLTPEGQYELSDRVLKEISALGVKLAYTLGGYGMGRMVTKPRVLGAATDLDLVKEMEQHGVVFSRGEPGAGIVGASGLVLGLGRLYGVRSVCLMGETSGYFVDPKSAQAVLTVLTKALGIELSFTELESKAKQIDQITSKLREAEAQPEAPSKEDLGYIG